MKPGEIPTNMDDTIDSRDVIEAISELESDKEYYGGHFTQTDELAALQALAEEGEGFGDWSHGECLIRDSYFQDYAQELAEDIGAINPDAAWPVYCIDWERATRELQHDYSTVEFDGVDYWIRS